MSQMPTLAVTPVDFPKAIAAVRDGKRVARESWKNPKDYCMLKDGFLMIYRDGEWFSWLVNDGDLLGEDWLILD
jgi:hypothetical protein